MMLGDQNTETVPKGPVKNISSSVPHCDSIRVYGEDAQPESRDPSPVGNGAAQVRACDSIRVFAEDAEETREGGSKYTKATNKLSPATSIDAYSRPPRVPSNTETGNITAAASYELRSGLTDRSRSDPVNFQISSLTGTQEKSLSSFESSQVTSSFEPSVPSSIIATSSVDYKEKIKIASIKSSPKSDSPLSGRDTEPVTDIKQTSSTGPSSTEKSPKSTDKPESSKESSAQESKDGKTEAHLSDSKPDVYGSGETKPEAAEADASKTQPYVAESDVAEADASETKPDVAEAAKLDVAVDASKPAAAEAVVNETKAKTNSSKSDAKETEADVEKTEGDVNEVKQTKSAKRRRGKLRLGLGKKFSGLPKSIANRKAKTAEVPLSKDIDTKDEPDSKGDDPKSDDDREKDNVDTPDEDKTYETKQDNVNEERLSDGISVTDPEVKVDVTIPAPVAEQSGANTTEDIVDDMTHPTPDVDVIAQQTISSLDRSFIESEDPFAPQYPETPKTGLAGVTERLFRKAEHFFGDFASFCAAKDDCMAGARCGETLDEPEETNDLVDQGPRETESISLPTSSEVAPAMPSAQPEAQLIIEQTKTTTAAPSVPSAGGEELESKTESCSPTVPTPAPGTQVQIVQNHSHMSAQRSSSIEGSHQDETAIAKIPTAPSNSSDTKQMHQQTTIVVADVPSSGKEPQVSAVSNDDKSCEEQTQAPIQPDTETEQSTNSPEQEELAQVTYVIAGIPSKDKEPEITTTDKFPSDDKDYENATPDKSTVDQPEQNVQDAAPNVDEQLTQTTYVIAGIPSSGKEPEITTTHKLEEPVTETEPTELTEPSETESPEPKVEEDPGSEEDPDSPNKEETIEKEEATEPEVKDTKSGLRKYFGRGSRASQPLTSDIPEPDQSQLSPSRRTSQKKKFSFGRGIRGVNIDVKTDTVAEDGAPIEQCSSPSQKRDSKKTANSMFKSNKKMNGLKTLSPRSREGSRGFPSPRAMLRTRAMKKRDDESDGIRVYGTGRHNFDDEVTSYPPHPTTRTNKSSFASTLKKKKKVTEKQVHTMKKVVRTSLFRMRSPTMKTIMTNHVQTNRIGN